MDTLVANPYSWSVYAKGEWEGGGRKIVEQLEVSGYPQDDDLSERRKTNLGTT